MAPIFESYRAGLWRSMDLLGVSESVKWKIFVAVGIQFIVSLAQATLPFVTTGVVQMALSGLLLLGAIIAFGNTIVVTQNDIIDPITKLDDAARAISEGNLDVDLPKTTQRDEIGGLAESFTQMNAYLHTVERQAEALANKDFDCEALDEEVPGTFGDLLERTMDSLQVHIRQIESDRERFKLLNYLVSHDIPNLLNVILGRGELLDYELETESQRRHLELMLDNANEILDVTDTVHQLTHSSTLEEVALSDVLRREIERVESTYSGATITGADSLPSDVYVLGNDLLHSLFGNLVTNAVEHNDSPTPTVEVSVESRSERVLVRVADDGPGIPDENREEFFDGVDPGSGLGLVKAVTERFGGEVRVEENDPGGTVFTVSLPTYSAAKKQRREGNRLDVLQGDE